MKRKYPGEEGLSGRWRPKRARPRKWHSRKPRSPRSLEEEEIAPHGPWVKAKGRMRKD